MQQSDDPGPVLCSVEGGRGEERRGGEGFHFKVGGSFEVSAKKKAARPVFIS